MTSEARASVGSGGDLQRPRRSEPERGSRRAGPGRRSRSREPELGAGGNGPARPGPTAPGMGGEAREGRTQHPPPAADPCPGMAE